MDKRDNKTSNSRATLRPAVSAQSVRSQRTLLMVAGACSFAVSSLIVVSVLGFALNRQCTEPTFVELTLPAVEIAPSTTSPKRFSTTKYPRQTRSEAELAPINVPHDPAEAAVVLLKLTPKVQECARGNGVTESTAKIRAKIGTNGSLQSAVTTSGNTGFQRCVLMAAQELRFPTLSEVTDLNYSFRLK